MAMTMVMLVMMMRMTRAEPVQIQQQSIVMQSLKPDHEDHSHVYSSFNDRDDDDCHHHHLNQFHEVHAADCFAMSFVLLYVVNQLSDQLNFMLINLMHPLFGFPILDDK